MNNQSYIFTLTLLGAVLLLGGCATTQVAQDAKGTGMKKVYEKPIPVVWKAMHKAITETGGDITQENMQDCTILAEYGVSAFSWGERIGIFCTKQSANTTETEVVSKRAVSVNITADDLTEKIYMILDSELK